MFPALFFPFFFEVPAVFYLGLWFLISVVQRSARVGWARGGRGHRLVGAHRWIFRWNVVVRTFLRRPTPRRTQPDEYGIEWAWDPRRLPA
jgi:hypothetical protein